MAQPTDVQAAMGLLIGSFHKYSAKEGDKYTLSKGELTELLNSELGGLFSKASDKSALDQIFKDLDADKSGDVDFMEYIILIATLTMLTNELLSEVAMAKSTDVQAAMGLLIGAFHKYSGKEGEKHTLSKGELTELLNSELGGLFSKASDKSALDKIFKDLDADKSGAVDFVEYITMIATLTMLTNEFFVKGSKK